MKNTPEVTTALARVAELLSKDKDFKELAYDDKRAVFHMVETWYSNYWDLKENQCKEFVERFIKTIRLPWCCEI